MQKINGYSKEEAEYLVRFMEEGRRDGKTLTSLFAQYGTSHCRAGGSVRNYYYKLLKTDNEDVRTLLKGSDLSAERIHPFSEREKKQMLAEILTERAKGYSVRRAIANVCGDDEKKKLRYQNKFRNMLKKQPEEVRAAAEQYGVTVSSKRPSSAFLEKRLKAEIDELYSRLAVSLRQENARLREQVRSLTEENSLLRGTARVRKALNASETVNHG